MFASIYPSNICFPSPKYRQALEVPLRYLKIHFTSSQCSWPIYERKWLNMSDIRSYACHRVHQITNSRCIRHLLISFLSFSLRRHCFRLSLKWHTSEDPIDFASLILNLFKTFLVYCSWDNQVLCSSCHEWSLCQGSISLILNSSWPKIYKVPFSTFQSYLHYNPQLI